MAIRIGVFRISRYALTLHVGRVDRRVGVALNAEVELAGRAGVALHAERDAGISEGVRGVASVEVQAEPVVVVTVALDVERRVGERIQRERGGLIGKRATLHATHEGVVPSAGRAGDEVREIRDQGGGGHGVLTRKTRRGSTGATSAGP